MGAGVAEAGDLDHRRVAQMEFCAGRQAEQIDAARGDVLAHLAGGQVEPARAQLVVQLGVDEVDLAQVRLVGVARHP
ncbi:MAG: hypothetical protein U0232_05070 [Thermomicrobiales bacterium]